MAIITTPSKTAIRGLQVDTNNGYLFASSFDDGFIYGYKLNNSGKKVLNFSKAKNRISIQKNLSPMEVRKIVGIYNGGIKEVSYTSDTPADLSLFTKLT